MDQEFYDDTDNFEQFLKESTHDFKMYPSRKVWYSLYNNLHPGSKWPSLAVCLLLVTAILFMDVSNNNKINKRAQSNANEQIENVYTNFYTPQLATHLRSAKNISSLLSPAPQQAKIKEKSLQQTSTPTTTTAETIAFATFAADDLANHSNNLSKTIALNQSNTEAVKTFNSLPKTIATLPKPTNVEKAENNLKIDFNILANDFYKANVNNSSTAATNESLLKKTYEEDFAFYHKPILSKWKKKAHLQFYITPSIGYRAWFKNVDAKVPSNALVAMRPNQPHPEPVNQNAAYNMEMGVAINYSLSKKFALQIGAQFNNTSYVINAGQLFHPTQTTILLENSNTGIASLEPHTSYYSSRQATGTQARLFNKTIQVSVPVGIHYQLAQKKNISWYAGASVQPTYMANGTANVLSADGRNYVSMPSLLRRWNANTAIETYVSIKTKAGFSLNVGPQFRYQLMSTYTKQYNYSEKLYNIGVKLGISRGF